MPPEGDVVARYEQTLARVRGYLLAKRLENNHDLVLKMVYDDVMEALDMKFPRQDKTDIYERMR